MKETLQQVFTNGWLGEGRWEAEPPESNQPFNFISIMFVIFFLLGWLEVQLPYICDHVSSFW